jgi:hypothetical protein
MTPGSYFKRIGNRQKMTFLEIVLQAAARQKEFIVLLLDWSDNDQAQQDRYSIWADKKYSDWRSRAWKEKYGVFIINNMSVKAKGGHYAFDKLIADSKYSILPGDSTYMSMATAYGKPVVALNLVPEFHDFICYDVKNRQYGIEMNGHDLLNNKRKRSKSGKKSEFYQGAMSFADKLKIMDDGSESNFKSFKMSANEIKELNGGSNAGNDVLSTAMVSSHNQLPLDKMTDDMDRREGSTRVRVADYQIRSWYYFVDSWSGKTKVNSARLLDGTLGDGADGRKEDLHFLEWHLLWQPTSTYESVKATSGDWLRWMKYKVVGGEYIPLVDPEAEHQQAQAEVELLKEQECSATKKSKRRRKSRH